MGPFGYMKSTRIHSLDPTNGFTDVEWLNIDNKDWDSTPAKIECKLDYWKLLHTIIDSEPHFEPYRGEYGELATLGISKGVPFTPDARMRDILLRAAETRDARDPSQGIADRRPDRESGQTASGNGRHFDRRTARSTPLPTWIWMRGRSGSIKRRSSLPPCFAEPREPDRSTGSV